jgi:hypothetical protein
METDFEGFSDDDTSQQDLMGGSALEPCQELVIWSGEVRYFEEYAKAKPEMSRGDRDKDRRLQAAKGL